MEHAFEIWSRYDTEKNELPRSRAARYQKEFSFNPDAEHQGILLIKFDSFKENKINIMVYKLYELTYDEVKIIDPEIEKIISKEKCNAKSIDDIAG